MELIISLYGHKGIVRELIWTPQGKYLLSACNSGGLFLWKGNFKDTAQGRDDVMPTSMINDKNYVY